MISCKSEPPRPEAILKKPVKSPSNQELVEETVYTEPAQSTDTNPRDELRLRVKVKDPKAIAKYRSCLLYTSPSPRDS